MEKQLLPRAELRPAYDKAVWLYVYRDFSGSEADRAAERIALRFGLTSYPQHHMIHPESLTRMADTGRSVASFLGAVERTQVSKGASREAADRLRAAEARAIALESRPDPKAAMKALDDDDDVVRIRAVGILAEKSPDAVAKRAPELLAVPNDPLRFAVCAVLGKVGGPEVAPALIELVNDPKESLNPNVLRISAVEALARCGDETAVEAIAPHAASGNYRNGLTGRAILTLVEIAKRKKKARPAVVEALRNGYPTPVAEERERRMCEALARRVHEALAEVTGKRVPFPDVYDEAARSRLRESW